METKETVQAKNQMGEMQTTVYDVWQQADGLHKGEGSSKWISFKNGFVRVRKSDWTTIVAEGWANGTERSFYVPSWHSCEVLDNPTIKFTRA